MCDAYNTTAPPFTNSAVLSCYRASVRRLLPHLARLCPAPAFPAAASSFAVGAAPAAASAAAFGPQAGAGPSTAPGAVASGAGASGAGAAGAAASGAVASGPLGPFSPRVDVVVACLARTCLLLEVGR